MLTVKELFIVNRLSDLVLVDNLSFTLREKDKIAIIGSEGSGQTTLLRYLYGEELDFINTMEFIARPHHISCLEQNINTKWKDHTVLSFLLEKENYEYLSNAYSFLTKLGFEYNEIMDRKIDSFSGGERAKIGLAKALMIEPDCLHLMNQR